MKSLPAVDRFTVHFIANQTSLSRCTETQMKGKKTRIITYVNDTQAITGGYSPNTLYCPPSAFD